MYWSPGARTSPTWGDRPSNRLSLTWHWPVSMFSTTSNLLDLFDVRTAGPDTGPCPGRGGDGGQGLPHAGVHVCPLLVGQLAVKTLELFSNRLDNTLLTLRIVPWRYHRSSSPPGGCSGSGKA